MTPLRIAYDVQPDCMNCSLNGQPRVHGYGTPGGLVIVGEAPGANEVRLGRPFIGQSGELLKRALAELGIDYEKHCYITNLCECRPPNNRDPLKREIKACSGRLRDEIHLARPTCLLLLGSVASQTFLGMNVSAARGRFTTWEGIPTIALYHPALVLRAPDAFRDFEFDLRKALRGPKPVYKFEDDGMPSVPYTVINGPDDFREVLASLKDRIVLDIETSERSPYLAEIGPVGFTDNPDHVFILPQHLLHGSCNEIMHVALTDGRLRTIGHNMAYEWSCFKHSFGWDIDIGGDTMLMHYSLDERSGGSVDDGTPGKDFHSLKTLGSSHYDVPRWKGLLPNTDNFLDNPPDILYRYLGLDVSVTCRLYDEFLPRVKAEGLEWVLENVMYRAIRPLSDMALRGVKLDPDHLRMLGLEWGSEVEELEDKLNEIAGRHVSISKPHDLAKFLFDELGLPPVDGRKTNKVVLEKLLRKHDIEAMRILDKARRTQHRIRTYCTGMIRRMEEGRIHTTYSLHGTDTGRLNSRNPNLQNIPARIGPALRDAFVSDDGWEFLEVDFSQLEIRVGAFVTQDKALLAFLREDRDIHAEMSCVFYNTTPDKITRNMRRNVKTVVFGIWYDRTAHSLAEAWNMPLSEAQRRINLIYDRFPEALQWKKDIKQSFLKGDAETGDRYVKSFFGRRRRYPLITRQNRGESLKQVVNAPIQSLASDITQIGGARIYDWADPDILQPVLTVHDSWLFQVRDGHMDEQAWRIKEELEKQPFPEFNVPLKVDMKRGPRWGSAQDCRFDANRKLEFFKKDA